MITYCSVGDLVNECRRITSEQATGGNRSDTKMTDETGEAKLDIAHKKQKIIKIKQEIQTLRQRLRHMNLTQTFENTNRHGRMTEKAGRQMRLGKTELKRHQNRTRT